MSDILDELTAVHRAVRAEGAEATVVLTRGYDAPVDDVWDAITSQERLSRWFLPVTGDLRLGGTYQLQGNAGGEIVRCEPPRLLAVTWLFGENPLPSQVTVRLSSDADGARTTLELEHAATVEPKFWDEYGAGAVGVGWDLGLLGLALHLSGRSIGNPEEWESSPEGREYATHSAQSWGAAMIASGMNPDDVARMVANATAFYAPPPQES